LPYQAVLEWAGRALDSSRVVFIDPIAQIDFGERQEWKGQADFMRQITGLSAHYESSIFLVAHTIKRGGKSGKTPLTGEEIQGAAEIKRLSHTVLLLDVHEEVESSVWREGKNRHFVTHDRTVIVDKARNGTGRGNRLAFEMQGPAFREQGVIAPKEKSASKKSQGNPSDRAYKD
jgi:RecA-family ATPase